MPPKPKFTREEVVNTALELVRRRGIGALTSRALGTALGSSARPTFTVFRDMDEVKSAVREQARLCFVEYMQVAESFQPAYKKRGMQWVRFAREEPMLFRLLFMQRTGDHSDFSQAMEIIPFGKEDDIAIIMRDYHATPEQAEHLFRQMWIHTYGLCVLCATKVCAFTDEEIAANLGEIFCGMIYILHGSFVQSMSRTPAQKGTPEVNLYWRDYPDLRSAAKNPEEE